MSFDCLNGNQILIHMNRRFKPTLGMDSYLDMCWEYLHPHLLFEIAKGVGTPLHLDKATRDHTYGFYARILVDLDLSIDLPKSIMVE